MRMPSDMVSADVNLMTIRDRPMDRRNASTGDSMIGIKDETEPP